MKRFKNEVVNGYNDKPIIWNIDGKMQELKLINVMWIILNSYKMTTQKDSIEGAKLAKSLDKIVSNELDIIEMDEVTYFWFIPIAERSTPALFGVSGNVIYTLIKDGFIKEETNSKGRK